MKKILIGAAILAAGLAALGRFAPAIQQRAMSKCHQMMSKCGEMLSQQTGSPAGTACTDTPGSEPAKAAEYQPAEPATAS